LRTANNKLVLDKQRFKKYNKMQIQYEVEFAFTEDYVSLPYSEVGRNTYCRDRLIIVTFITGMDDEKHKKNI
jgi:hypothetical protein